MLTILKIAIEYFLIFNKYHVEDNQIRYLYKNNIFLKLYFNLILPKYHIDSFKYVLRYSLVNIMIYDYLGVHNLILYVFMSYDI